MEQPPKEQVKQAVNQALQDFENNVTRAARFGSVRTSQTMRDTLGSMLLHCINRNVNHLWDTGFHHADAEQYAGGLVELGPLLSASQVDDVKQFLALRPVYNTPTISDGDLEARWIGKTAEQERFGAYPIDDILEAPHLLELINSPKITASVQKMLGDCPPVLTLLSLWWAFPGSGGSSTYLGQNFHRDADGLQNVALFTYLTDVDENCGPHQYIEGSANREALAEALADKLPIRVRAGRRAGETIDSVDFFLQDHGDDLNEIYEEYLADHIRTIERPAGHGFVTDTFGLHRGSIPAHEARLIFVARFGTMDNVNADHRKAQHFLPWSWEKIAHRLPDTFNTRYLNRLFLV